jgi:hypothetical protein
MDGRPWINNGSQAEKSRALTFCTGACCMSAALARCRNHSSWHWHAAGRSLLAALAQCASEWLGRLIQVTEGKTKAARRMLPMVPEVYAVLKSKWQSQNKPFEGSAKSPKRGSAGPCGGEQKKPRLGSRAKEKRCLQVLTLYSLTHLKSVRCPTKAHYSGPLACGWAFRYPLGFSVCATHPAAATISFH